MILINLLPEEFRPRRRLSVKTMAMVGAGVAANTLLLAWAGWLYFGELAQVESEREGAAESLQSLQPQLAYHKSLEAERKVFESRESTLDQIAQSRISWTAKVDQLIDVVDRGSNTQKYLVWFNDLTASRQYDKRNKTAGLFKADARCGSDNIALVANFMDDVSASPFIEGFQSMAPPEGQTSEVDETLVPPRVWSFTLQLALRAREEVAEKAAKATKPAKKGKDAKSAEGAKSTEDAKGKDE